MTIRPQKKTTRGQEHSLRVKQNKKYQALLAALIISFALVFAVVISSIGMPSSRVWRDNILMRLIANTQEAIRNRP